MIPGYALLKTELLSLQAKETVGRLSQFDKRPQKGYNFAR